MSYSGSGDSSGWRNDGRVRPHAFDPDTQPELFRGVLTRRIFAFLIDLVVLTVPVVLGYIFIAVFGVITLGLGWMLFWLAWPATVVWAIVYYGASIGGPHSATLGMRAMDLELRTWYGAPLTTYSPGWRPESTSVRPPSAPPSVSVRFSNASPWSCT